MHIRASKRGSNYSGILVFFLFLHPFLGMLHLPTLAFCHSVVFASVDDDGGVDDGSAWLRRKRKWSLEGNELESGEDGNKLEIR